MRGTVSGHDMLIATTHLESPLGNNDLRSSERKAQLKQVRGPVFTMLRILCRDEPVLAGCEDHLKSACSRARPGPTHCEAALTGPATWRGQCPECSPVARAAVRWSKNVKNP